MKVVYQYEKVMVYCLLVYNNTRRKCCGWPRDGKVDVCPDYVQISLIFCFKLTYLTYTSLAIYFLVSPHL